MVAVNGTPPPGRKYQILRAFTEGIKDRPHTTFGNVEADVLAHFVPGVRRGNFVEGDEGSDWPK